MTEARRKYENYLQSDHWAGLRGSLFQKHGKRCMACNVSDKPIHAHHLIYRAAMEDSTVDDLMPLCEVCHNSLHKIPFIVQQTELRPDWPSRVAFVRRELWNKFRLGSRPAKKKKHRHKMNRKQRKRLNALLYNPSRGYRQPRKFMDYSTYQAKMVEKPIWST